MTRQLMLTLKAYVDAEYLLTPEQLHACRVEPKVREKGGGRGREGGR
jgi:hypothetical protein